MNSLSLSDELTLAISGDVNWNMSKGFEAITAFCLILLVILYIGVVYYGAKNTYEFLYLQ